MQKRCEKYLRKDQPYPSTAGIPEFLINCSEHQKRKTTNTDESKKLWNNEERDGICKKTLNITTTLTFTTKAITCDIDGKVIISKQQRRDAKSHSGENVNGQAEKDLDNQLQQLGYASHLEH